MRNGVSYTRACLESLFGSMPKGWESGCAYEVIVFDDASTDSTGKLLAEYGDQIQLITGDGDGSYALNNNLMGKRAKGRWLCMLNNDTVLAPGWLEPMLELGEERSSAGVIGNIHVFPGRAVVNHAGVVFNEERVPRNLYDGLAIDTPGLCQDRELQGAMAACWLTPRVVFEQLGGFDVAYRTGCEDVDYCQRVRADGGSVWIAGKSKIVHHGGSTPGRYKFDTINERRFLEQWSAKITPDWRTLGEAEGVDWPNRSLCYRALRSMWRNRLVKVVLSPIVKTHTGSRLRQGIVRRLVHESK